MGGNNPNIAEVFNFAQIISMLDESEHPITTPKGASAFSLVLAAVGVFTPFIFDLKAALGFAGLSLVVLIWIYARDMAHAVKTGRWATSLAIPLVSALAIAAMAAISLASKKPSPSLPAALTKEDVYREMDDWLSKNKSSPARETFVPSRPPIIIEVERDPVETLAPTTPRPQIRNDDELNKRLEALQERSEISKKLSKCQLESDKIRIGLYRLQNQAAHFQNEWAYTRDGKDLLEKYQSWNGAVGQFFSDNREKLKDTSAFSNTPEQDVTPNALLGRVSGERVWQNFDARANALEQLRKSYDNEACAAEAAALRAFDARGTSKKSDPTVE